VSPKSRFPFPSITGKTISRTSSTRSCSIRVCTSCALPWTTTFPLCSRFSLATSSTTSPLRTVVLLHVGDWSVFETTYFGIELNLSANSPSRDGHAAAKPS
jgi:hypothetical protein